MTNESVLGPRDVVPAVSMAGITKKFPGVVANDDVSLTLFRGEVHALLGENGAGKSTLSNVLTGLYRPDAGHIEVDGERVDFASPKDAIAAGIGMVHQHFRLVESFTVAENVVLGQAGRYDRAAAEREVRELGERFNMPVDPSARIWELSVGEQQRVEILKALARNAKVLILDEPTAVLTPQEAEALFVNLRTMAADDRAVVFISHKLDEVMAVSDRAEGSAIVAAARRSFLKDHLAPLLFAAAGSDAAVTDPQWHDTTMLSSLDDVGALKATEGRWR